MPRLKPDTLPLVHHGRRTTLTRTDDGYEGECPACLGTLTAPVSTLNIHRDGTFSTKRSAIVGCSGGCALALRVAHSVAEELPDTEFNEDAQYAFAGDFDDE